MSKKPLDVRITRLFKKYIASRPHGNCQVLFALNQLDGLVMEIMREITLEDNDQCKKKHKTAKEMEKCERRGARKSKES